MTHEAIRSWLLVRHPETVDSDRLMALETSLREAIEEGAVGAVVELGCYKGATSLWLRSILDEMSVDTPIHVYDSFHGLPQPTKFDSEYLGAGDVSTSVDELVDLHHRWGKRLPVIHPGWFADTLPHELPNELAFAYLDGDLYESILISLKTCVPRLSRGGVVIVDDYADLGRNPKAWDGLPGVKKACDDYFGRADAMDVLVGEGDLAYGRFRKRGE